jgi:hypothetical protein
MAPKSSLPVIIMFFFVLQATIAIEDGFQCVAKYNIG